MINTDLKNSIDLVLKEYNKNPDSYSKLALFDMDNTLLQGDIGEAVYAKLRAEKHHVHIGWKEYKDCLHKDGPSIAYRKILKAKRDLKRDTISEITKMIVDDSSDIFFEEFENTIIKATPSPNPIMQSLVKYINQIGMDVFVITASSKYIADVIISNWFEIKIENVFGVEHQLESIDEELILTGELIEPAPILEGKASVYMDRIDRKPPLIAAGDSLNDIPMLNLVPKEGLIIIAKRSDEYTDKLISEIDSDAKIIII